MDRKIQRARKTQRGRGRMEGDREGKRENAIVSEGDTIRLISETPTICSFKVQVL